MPVPGKNLEAFYHVSRSLARSQERAWEYHKARYMGIGKVDKDMALFYEDKKEKEKEEK